MTEAVANFSAPVPPEAVRLAVRDMLMASAEYQNLDPETRQTLAHSLVRISHTARALARLAGSDDFGVTADLPRGRSPLAIAQSAGSEFSGVAAERVAGTTRQILNAVSFPRFVSELITGVFKAIVDSNQQQMHSFVDLIRNVSASIEGFADANMSLEGARQWLAERFPGSFVVEGEADPFGPSEEPLTPEEQAEQTASRELRLRPGATMPSQGALRTALGIGEGESVPTGNPESLVPVARMAMARNRQQMLASMVMLGLQRIVIDSGRLHAAMRFHIDTRSAAADDRGSSFDLRNEVNAEGRFGFGPWGVDARVKNTIGYVSTQRTQTTEEMNTDLDLNSSVELIFRTDYFPLERLAGGSDINRIRVNALNPEAEQRIAAEERRVRQTARRQEEAERRDQLGTRLSQPQPQPQSQTQPQPQPQSQTQPQPQPQSQTQPQPQTPAQPQAPAQPRQRAPTTADTARRSEISSQPPLGQSTTGPTPPGQANPAP
jgi:hypothetical protein